MMNQLLRRQRLVFFETTTAMRWRSGIGSLMNEQHHHEQHVFKKKKNQVGGLLGWKFPNIIPSSKHIHSMMMMSGVEASQQIRNFKSTTLRNLQATQSSSRTNLSQVNQVGTTNPLTASSKQEQQSHSTLFKKVLKMLKLLVLLELGLIGLTAFLYGAMKFCIWLFHFSDIENPYSQLYNKKLLELLTPVIQLFEGIDRYLKTMSTILIIGLEYYWLLTTSNINPHYWFTEKPDKTSLEFIEKKKQLHTKSAHRLLALFSENKGVYIKLGQHIASLGGFLPDEYIQVLSVMRDRAPTIAFDNVKKIIYQDFGKTVEELFEYFDPNPLASGSIAQVHRAKTKDGKTVAVKVQYHFVRFYFAGDMYTREAATKLSIRLYYMQEDPKNIDELLEVNDQFNNEIKDSLNSELNFLHEAENAKLAAANFKGSRPDVYIPKVYDDLTSSRVLTMEFIENACNANDVERIRQMGFNESDIARRIISTFAEQLFIHGHLHGDCHQSNVFVRQNPKKPSEPQIVILDHGLYKHLGDDFRQKYAQFWISIVLNDKKGMHEYCRSLGINDYKLYASMIMMQGLDSNGELSAWSEKQMTEEDFAKFSEQFQSKRSEFMNIYRHMPKEMLLISRTDNILRSLNRELGAQVNRFSIMARIAAKGASMKTSENLHSWSQRFRRWRSEMYFEFRLFVISVQTWFISIMS
ncbi:hypothetical protein FDP41_010667 [Naegleria fowleri]|uniref:ABC1 atypical kinase-like domain-containing protein n=1 Tax=Naegleria fowleri TaxID=5763 RepID=A0A6A5C9G7_NAEFO|nr:uncharacterized protein FDP41_010667 [Naegleria fowleri]KAF0983602.1 hypothetical protein FDP41_010667 [Naegleria fowleri]